MTPGARVAAAIEVLDDILAGTAPEKALTGWGRSHRFAGSKDRAAIRDHVFDALRCQMSYAWRGGAQTGRGIMIGAMRAANQLDELFSGIGHAPAPVAADESGAPIETAPRDVRLDMPDWLLPHFDRALGDQADGVLTQLQSRAGVFLRVNTARVDRTGAVAILAEDGIEAVPMDDIDTALQVTANERKVSRSKAYLEGLVELQDPSSQKAILSLGVTPGLRVLDYCAGGGGKSLALAALGAQVTAHDIDPQRMVDIAPRAARAGVVIQTATKTELQSMAPFDLVLCDAPCSGSGTWRRAPMAKWDLTPDRLDELISIQAEVLEEGAALVRAGGTLAYATCSVYEEENSVAIQEFMERNSSFELRHTNLTVTHVSGDGFFLANLVSKG